MKPKIIAKHRYHLIEIIAEEIKLHGNECDLNHIDVSRVDNFFRLFSDHDSEGDPYDDTQYEDFSDFNGDISRWDVSHVRNMEDMFFRSKFKGDISNWDVSNVESMNSMFSDAEFNGDISKWNVSNVKDIHYMFCRNYTQSLFEGDLSDWKPYSLNDISHAFEDAKCITPYWALIQDKEERKKAIDAYQEKKKLQEDLNIELNNNNIEKKKMKI